MTRKGVDDYGKATFGGARKGDMVRARGIKDARYLSRGIMKVCKLMASVATNSKSHKKFYFQPE